MPEIIRYRAGTVADSEAVFKVLMSAILEMRARLGFDAGPAERTADFIAERWRHRRSLYEHLARTAEQFWVAESGDEIIGYARSILRDGSRELTEFFVRPGRQSGGVGRELLSRAFPRGGARHRSIIATTDVRAQARYLKSGVYPRFPIAYFYRAPEATVIETDLQMTPADDSEATLAALRALDAAVLGFTRDVDHRWLLSERQVFLYLRRGEPVGYGYAGQSSGPFAVLDTADFPAVLAHAETTAANAQQEELGLHAPMINRAAVDYLLERGFKMDPFLTLYMSDGDEGRFDRYVVTNPPLFV